jgi:UDP-N-acetylglucosamine:LPS N-acetylglucosamine transferase
MRRKERISRNPGTVCLVASQGGHLQQMLRFERIYKERPHFLITTPDVHATAVSERFADVKHIANINEGRGLRNPLLLVVAFLQTFWYFITERPVVLISTGSGIAVPAFLLARLFGVHSIYVESFTRIKELSQTGRVAYRLAEVLFVQHQSLLDLYPKARYAGSVYENL